MQNISAGQLLCGGLFSADCLSHWLSSVAMSHVLVNNPNNKDLLLRVRLAIARDAPPVTLLQQIFNILHQVKFPPKNSKKSPKTQFSFAHFSLKGGKLQTRLGVLTLLSTWLSHCPNAVTQFLKLPNAVGFLTPLVFENSILFPSESVDLDLFYRVLSFQVASNEHDDQEVLVQSMYAFVLGLCVVFNDDSNDGKYSKVY